VRPIHLASLLPLVLAGCAAPASAPPAAAVAAPSSAPASAPSAGESAASAPALLPAPYTAEQLRASSRRGRTYVFRVEAPGKPTVLREMTFTAVEAERAEVATTMKDEAGKVLEAKPPQSATWVELRHHGEFPRDRTTTAPAEVTIPAGTFQCTVYTVRGEGGEVSRFSFAKDLAGPPVVFTTEKDGQRVMTSTLVVYRPGE
jgi:hypothetical protein